MPDGTVGQSADCAEPGLCRKTKVPCRLLGFCGLILAIGHASDLKLGQASARAKRTAKRLGRVKKKYSRHEPTGLAESQSQTNKSVVVALSVSFGSSRCDCAGKVGGPLLTTR